MHVTWTCARHVNHCYGDFVRMTWNFFDATVWPKSSSTRNLSPFGSVVLEKWPKKHLFWGVFWKGWKSSWQSHHNSDSRDVHRFMWRSQHCTTLLPHNFWSTRILKWSKRFISDDRVKYWLCRRYSCVNNLLGCTLQVYCVYDVRILKLYRYLSRFATLEGAIRGVYVSQHCNPFIWKCSITPKGKAVNFTMLAHGRKPSRIKSVSTTTTTEQTSTIHTYTKIVLLLLQLILLVLLYHYFLEMALHVGLYMCVWHIIQNDKMCVSTATYLIWRCCCALTAIRHICIFSRSQHHVLLISADFAKNMIIHSV